MGTQNGSNSMSTLPILKFNDFTKSPYLFLKNPFKLELCQEKWMGLVVCGLWRK